MVRLSVDVEAFARGHRTMPLPDEVQREIVVGLKQRLLELVRADQDVVVDLSFWSLAMREEWRALLAPTGVVPEIVHVVADRETILARLEARNAEHADAYRLPPELAAQYVDHFEPPTPAEGPVTVVRTDLA